ncbi:UNVERIFIED_CONTAM: hypothetical protein K2H54_031720 [Gekko kuhli]
MESNQKSGDGLAGTQKEAALRTLIQRTGYNLIQENGQRKYGGPPPGWDGPPPERGCEIFIGKLPRDLFEDELIPLCSSCEINCLLQYIRFSSESTLVPKRTAILLSCAAITAGALLGEGIPFTRGGV